MQIQAPQEIFYTPAELAKALKVHPETIRKTFRDEPGVLKLGGPTQRGRRARFTLRIPASVAARVLAAMSVGGKAA
jgi:hypothetical protein